MTQHEDQTASAVSIDPLLFLEKFDQLSADLAPLFTRREPRAHAAAYVRGLLADLPRKNCWTLSEHIGQARAFGMQRLLYQAVWDEEAARDVVRSFALRHLAAPGAVQSLPVPDRLFGHLRPASGLGDGHLTGQDQHDPDLLLRRQRRQGLIKFRRCPGCS